MKILMTLTLLISLAACTKMGQPSESPSSSSEYAMKCEGVGELLRCENQEAVCYGPRSGSIYLSTESGISCKFKK